MSTDSTIVQRIELLAGKEHTADLHTFSQTLSTYTTHTAEEIYAQLTAQQPLTQDLCDALASHINLPNQGQWIMRYLSDHDLDHGTVAHVRTLARMVANGHTWRRLSD